MCVNIAKGWLSDRGQHIVRGYMNDLDVGSSVRVRLSMISLLKYKVKAESGLFQQNELAGSLNDLKSHKWETQALREKLGFKKGEIMLLSLSRVSYEKISKPLLRLLPKVLEENTHIKLIVWRWAYLDDLKTSGQAYVYQIRSFTGMIPPKETAWGTIKQQISSFQLRLVRLEWCRWNRSQHELWHIKPEPHWQINNRRPDSVQCRKSSSMACTNTWKKRWPADSLKSHEYGLCKGPVEWLLENLENSRMNATRIEPIARKRAI